MSEPSQKEVVLASKSMDSSAEGTMPQVVCIVKNTETPVTPTSDGRRPYRKCVIGAVATILTVAILIAGVLVAIKLITDANVETAKIQHRIKSHDTVIDETFYTDKETSGWLLKYHLTDDAKRDTWAINEFDKGIQILKLQLKSGEYGCFVIRQPVINSTASEDSILPSNKSSSVSIEEPSSKKNIRYRVTRLFGDVTSLLGKAGQEFCTDVDIYIALPATQDDDTVNGERIKRQARYYTCYIDWLNCLIVTFQGRRTTNYYACLPVCTQVF